MRNLTIIGALALFSTPAGAIDIGCEVASVSSMLLGTVQAEHCYDVPEMSAGAAVAAIALVIGVASVIRERSRRK